MVAQECMRDQSSCVKVDGLSSPACFLQLWLEANSQKKYGEQGSLGLRVPGSHLIAIPVCISPSSICPVFP